MKKLASLLTINGLVPTYGEMHRVFTTERQNRIQFRFWSNQR